ncbi:hypothetical protein ACFE04_021944 [Oxalis oulophora]
MEIVKHNETLAHGVTGDNFISHIPFQVLSWKPKVLYYPNFATAKECQHIINMAKPLLEPSKIALRIGDTVENTQDVRTSSGTFLSAWDDRSGILERIEEKIAKITMIPAINGEDFNVLRYENGQKYDSHYDAFDPSEYGPQKSQRVATFILYLSDVEEGGETMFPFESGWNMSTYNYNDCIGLKVKPRKGDGILFYSLLMNGTIDPLSIHGSCPVIRGEKWTVSSFINSNARAYIFQVASANITIDLRKHGYVLLVLIRCRRRQGNQKNGINMDGSYKSNECNGLKVKPRKGDGLLFHTSLVDGKMIKYRDELAQS